MSSAEQYILEIEKKSIINEKIRKQSNQLAALRLGLVVVSLGLLYSFFSLENYFYLIPALIGILGFVIAVIKHRKVLREKKIIENIISINKDELSYLKERKLTFNNGDKFLNSIHDFTYDLDIFGHDSLFHHLNRTTTYLGEVKLASRLMNLLPADEIKESQLAVQELAGKLVWRQRLAAIGKSIADSKEAYQKLSSWAKERQSQITKTVNVLIWLMPILFFLTFLTALAGYIGLKAVFVLFLANLILFATQGHKIKAELVDAKNISGILQKYSWMLECIEHENFSSEKLQNLQSKLKSAKTSFQIERLSKIFLKIQGVNFDLGAILLNGTMAYHIHALRTLIIWKEKYAEQLVENLNILGEIDGLCSLANFSFNNTNYVFPELNSNYELAFTELGHPLIPENLRVTNDIKLSPSNFILLTGSNMSGKSTFLRTLGVNMVLSEIGAPICATMGNVHALPIMVSMRQTDSLSAGESYFFAEVKRLKSIIEKLKIVPCFVLLDEILRGTNSDDKHSGTIGVIEKILEYTAVGGIATHDLEVCNLVAKYPKKLENKNFEVQIVNDELVFDYKLRSGVCQNKSATFLMKKMEII